MGIWEDLTGKSSANASNAAAADTYSKIMSATGDYKAYGDDYASKFSELSKMFAPYGEAGKAALQRLMGGLGLGGEGGSAAFADAYRALPGYEAGLETGTRAVTAGANAGNMLNSGRTLKALQRFGSDYEDQRSGSYLDRLFALAGTGQQATGQQVATEGQGLQGQMATRQGAFQGAVQAAPVIGQGQVAGEQAKQSALTNLMSTGAYLGGAALGGGRLPRFA